MEIKIKTKNNILIITLKGSIDSKTAPEVQQKVLESSVNSKNVIIDLTSVDFVSSAGLRVLLMLYRQIKVKNGKVVLVGVSEEITDIMSMTGFINFFEIIDTVENALNTY
ncbi:MAG: STAS domain-containing protein [Prolixibacteraceae bacterium]|jgi:anti-sigma B factor antagonist|nr:STAS domain-containing protein [Prolixibacteraceae bacterium]MBT6764619.1 STAS domain-containing protein [Prolixibacteraceae bacterium]MBT6997524.1 STAS domain-containing protein [Prolixibacteraceae bacterium]MBT7394582.1 STAS domain-containing protein [Prolixibacteraceae bacterium]